MSQSYMPRSICYQQKNSPFRESAIGVGISNFCVYAVCPRINQKDPEDRDAIKSIGVFDNVLACNTAFVVRNMAAMFGEFFLMNGKQMINFGDRHVEKLEVQSKGENWPVKKTEHVKIKSLMESNSYEEVIFFNKGYNRFVLDIDCPLDIPVNLRKCIHFYDGKFYNDMMPNLREMLTKESWDHLESIKMKALSGQIKGGYKHATILLCCIIEAAKKALLFMDLNVRCYLHEDGPKKPEFVIKASIFDEDLEMTETFPKWSFHILVKNMLGTCDRIYRLYAILVIYFMIAAYFGVQVSVDHLTADNVPTNYDEIVNHLTRARKTAVTAEEYKDAKFFYDIIDLGLYSDSHNLRMTYSTKPDKGIHTNIVTKGHTFMDSLVRPYFEKQDHIRFFKVIGINSQQTDRKRTQKSFDIDSIDDEFIQKAVKAALIRFDDFEFRDITMSGDIQVINFDRKHASTKECPFCKNGRVHTNDNNLYMVIAQSASGRFGSCYCRKHKEAVDIINNVGICVYSERTDENSFVPRIKNMVEKINKDQFSGLYQNDLPGRFSDNFTRYIEESDKEIKQLSFDNDIIFVQASTGLGKTKAVGNYIKSLPEANQVLAVSFRVALSFNLLDAFNKIIVGSEAATVMTTKQEAKQEVIPVVSKKSAKKVVAESTKNTGAFDHYRNSKDRITEFNRMIIQVESFHRIATNAVGNDMTLVLDESESIIAQLYSGLSKYQTDNLKTFIYLIGKAKKIVAIDAYMTVRTINVINYIKRFYRATVTTTMYRNTFKSHQDTRYFLTKDRNGWLGALCYYLRLDRKCVVAVNSKKDAQIIYNAVKDVVKKPLRIGTYSSDTTESVKKEHFQDVNNYWDKYDLLIYTPTAGAGISFEKEHYDYLFGFFTNSSCEAEACLQMLARVRNIKHKKAYIYLDPMTTSRPMTRDEIFTSFIDSHETNVSYTKPDYYVDLDGRKMIMDSPETEIAMTNLVMRNRSQADFVGRFTSILAAYATKIEIYDNTWFTPYEYEKYREETDIKNAAILVEAQPLTKTEYNTLCEKSDLGCDITTEEKIRMEKYGLCKLFNIDQTKANDTTFKDYNKVTVKTKFANFCTLPNVHDLGHSARRMKEILGTAEMSKVKRLHGELFKDNKFTNCSRLISITQLLHDVGLNTLVVNSTFTLLGAYQVLVDPKKQQFKPEYKKLLMKIYNESRMKLEFRPRDTIESFDVFMDFFKKFLVEICKTTFGIKIKFATDNSVTTINNSAFVYQENVKDRTLSATHVPKVMAFGYLDRIYAVTYLSYASLNTDEREEFYEQLYDPADGDVRPIRSEEDDY